MSEFDGLTLSGWPDMTKVILGRSGSGTGRGDILARSLGSVAGHGAPDQVGTKMRYVGYGLQRDRQSSM